MPMIDLFSGMVCASMGFKEAGFEPVTALEMALVNFGDLGRSLFNSVF